MPKVTAKKKAKPKKKVKLAPKTPATEAVKLPVAKAKPAEKTAKTRNYFYANGKRKTSIACVRLYANGKGTVTVNDRTFENYFPVGTDQDKIIAPLRATSTQKIFDISARIFGGGIHSQAEALRHGIAKALLVYNPEFRTTLKPVGFLTRDSRVKERKKYGLKRARRAPQWQKR